jgi:hypothetical protein
MLVAADDQKSSPYERTQTTWQARSQIDRSQSSKDSRRIVNYMLGWRDSNQSLGSSPKRTGKRNSEGRDTRAKWPGLGARETQKLSYWRAKSRKQRGFWRVFSELYLRGLKLRAWHAVLPNWFLFGAAIIANC